MLWPFEKVACRPPDWSVWLFFIKWGGFINHKWSRRDKILDQQKKDTVKLIPIFKNVIKLFFSFYNYPENYCSELLPAFNPTSRSINLIAPKHFYFKLFKLSLYHLLWILYMYICVYMCTFTIIRYPSNVSYLVKFSK